MNLLTRAPRDANGRVAGEPPPVLVPNVVRRLTVREQEQFRNLVVRQGALKKQMADLLLSWGLDSKQQTLHVTEHGDVIDVGRPQARY